MTSESDTTVIKAELLDQEAMEDDSTETEMFSKFLQEYRQSKENQKRNLKKQTDNGGQEGDEASQKKDESCAMEGVQMTDGVSQENQVESQSTFQYSVSE